MDRLQVIMETPDLSKDGVGRLEAQWRALEVRSRCSFFQSWTWIGCRIAQRFTAPRLARAFYDGALVGLALFNRSALALAPRTLWLHETGHASEDRVFVEHNGPLVADECADEARLAILRTALAEAGTLVLSGVDASVLAAAAGLGVCHVRAVRPAPFASLDGIDEAGWRAGLGSATRAQLGRSRRRLEALGPVTWRQTCDAGGARAELDRLAALHQARWQRAGAPGAFAEPAFVRFHAELLARAMPRGEASLGWLAAGDRHLCMLYEFRWGGTVFAYQSGVDMEASPQASPGLVAHAHAIGDALRAGYQRYDFLAGEARYKRNLGDGVTDLTWLELSDRWTARGMPLSRLREARMYFRRAGGGRT